jgi:hypothetical protein
LPNVSPTTITSPTRSVPVWTIAVATGAAVLVELGLDDRADGVALRVGLELLEVGDEQDHLDQLVEPDAGPRRHGHERRVAAVLLDDDTGLDSSVLTRSGFESGLSILLRAMMIGTLAAFAWLIASSVWGMTPSSAATTTTAMSVTFAPRPASR